MHLNTPEALASLPHARIVRRADAILRIKRATISDNTYRRAAYRLSVIQSAAAIQTAQAIRESLGL